VCSQARLGGESLAADVAMKGPIFGALDLGIVVSQVLLEI
jgi:hypothetical protein